MHQHFLKPFVLAAAAFALTAVVPLTVHAQDRDEHHDQQPADHHDDHPAMKRDDHAAMKRDDNRPDPAVQYRHDHPHASARCHDGFFTSTHDRNRACSKHGGIDVWLVL